MTVIIEDAPLSLTEQCKIRASEWVARTARDRSTPEDFDERMSDLYRWLNDRKESVICLISHFGVIEWLLDGERFENCEFRVVDMDAIKPKALRAPRQR